MKIVTHVMLMFTLLLVSALTAEAVQPIDQFAVMDQVKWNCAKSIAVTMFPVVGEFKGEKKPEYYQNDFASKLASSLRRIPGIEKVDVVDGKSAVSADILITGEFKDLTTGSRALRFWVGFGAGKSFCRADMKGIDPKSGSEVFSLDHARGSAMDIVSDDELMENIDEVVEDVAAGLTAARGACISGSPSAK